MTILNMVGGGKGEISESFLSHYVSHYSHSAGSFGGYVSGDDKDYMWETSNYSGRCFLSEIDDIYYGSINGESSVSSSTNVGWARINSGTSVRIGPMDGVVLPMGTTVIGILVSDNGVNSFFSVGDPAHNTIAEFTVSYVSSSVGYSSGDLIDDTYYPIPREWSASDYAYVLYPLKIELPE